MFTPARALLYGLLIVLVTKEIFAKELRLHKELDEPSLIPTPQSAGKVLHFVKSSERTIRSAPLCDNTTGTTLEVTYGNDVSIQCSCNNSGDVSWFDDKCQEIKSSTRIRVAATRTLFITNFSSIDSLSYECKQLGVESREICSDKTDIIVVVPVSSSSAGIVVFLILLSVALVILACCARKYKTRISLCLRDTCQLGNGKKDGKVYDAYVSIGVTETDRRFVESFVYDVLQKKCGYNLLVDDRNLLPKLDYSDGLQANLHKSRRLIVVFSPTYMTHDWCMYCFNEGLRKIVELQVPTIFVITDHTILSEMRSHSDVIAHIPQVVLTQYQTATERQHAVERVRQHMPPPTRFMSTRRKNGMRSPMLHDAESIHRSDINFNGNGTAVYTEDGTEYTFGSPPEKIADDIQKEYDEVLEEPGPDEYVTAVRTGEDIDPDKVKVHQYGARKDFYSLTMSDDDM